MTLKQASFDIHKQLSAVSSGIKRSHCRELIAAAFHLNSMASAESNGFILPDCDLPFNTQSLVVDDVFDETINDIFTDRSLALIPFIDDKTTFNITAQAIIKFQLAFISFKELIEQFEMSGLTEGLNESEGYWYWKRENGQQLISQAQIEFANSFERQLKDREQRIEQFKTLFLYASDRGSSDAEYYLSFLCGDEDRQDFLQDLSKKRNSKAIVELYEESGNEEYLYLAAMHGSYEALEKIVSEYSVNASFAENNAFQAHYYNAIAEHYGYRLTESSLEAIGDFDYGWSEYGQNDDYYGPLYVGGCEAINLPNIEKDLELEAIDKAKHDLQNLNIEIRRFCKR